MKNGSRFFRNGFQSRSGSRCCNKNHALAVQQNSRRMVCPPHVRIHCPFSAPFFVGALPPGGGTLSRNNVLFRLGSFFESGLILKIRIFPGGPFSRIIGHRSGNSGRLGIFWLSEVRYYWKICPFIPFWTKDRGKTAAGARKIDRRGFDRVTGLTCQSSQTIPGPPALPVPPAPAGCSPAP